MRHFKDCFEMGPSIHSESDVYHYGNLHSEYLEVNKGDNHHNLFPHKLKATVHPKVMLP